MQILKVVDLCCLLWLEWLFVLVVNWSCLFACPCLSEPHREVMEDGCLPPVSPLVEAEMMRIDNVLSNFGDSFCDAQPLLPHQTPQRIKTCKKRKFIWISQYYLFSVRLLHCTLQLFTGVCTRIHTTPVFLSLSRGSHLPSRLHRWAWCKDSRAGLESVWCDQSVPCSLSQVLLRGPELHSRSHSQAALHHGGGL